MIRRKALEELLISSKENGFVKILTGLRRSGKSYLLFNIFKNRLLEDGVQPDHIVEINLEHPTSARLLDPIELDKHIRSKIKGDGKTTFVLIDEIQYCGKSLPKDIDLSTIHPDDRERMFVDFYRVLNGLRTTPHVDVYVTGSNSRMLSTDVATEFRGRGQVVHVTPLSFAEVSVFRGDAANSLSLLQDYLRFGGLPECVLMTSDVEKQEYLKNLYETIYVRDVMERNKLKNEFLLEKVIDMTMSSVGSLTNPTKLANAIQSVAGVKTNQPIIAKYLKVLEDAMLIERASRYDVKGRHYLDYPSKYYATDPGLRNARLNFRQFEPTHLMENVIYNELRRRGYSVDVGVVPIGSNKTGKHEIRQCEIDFVVNDGPRQIYVQSAYAIPDEAKREQETLSLRRSGNAFKKVVVTNDPFQTRTYDDDGIAYIGLADFLLHPDSLASL